MEKFTGYTTIHNLKTGDNRMSENPHWPHGPEMSKESICFTFVYWFYQNWWGLRDQGTTFAFDYYGWYN